MQLTVNATELYWVGGAGNWNDVTQWSLTSGGPSAGRTPLIDDDVIFDSNSGISSNDQVILNATAEINKLSIESTPYFTFYGSEHNLILHSDLKINSTIGFELDGDLIFKNDKAITAEIQTNNVDFDVNIKFVEGSWSLKNHLRAGLYNTIFFNSGAIQTNGYSVHANNIFANTAPVSLDFTGSHISVYNDFDISSARNIGGRATYIVLSETTSREDVSLFALDGDEIYEIVRTCGALTAEYLVISDYNGADISCNDSCDGSIEVTASGSPGPFAYRFGAGSFLDITVWDDICAGGVTVTVRDSSVLISPGNYLQCTLTGLTLAEPSEIILDLRAAERISCEGLCDGSATVEISGGTEPYTIEWESSGETTVSPSALCPGNNPVSLVDINGCITQDTIFIADPIQIVADAIATNPSCFGLCDGEIAITPSGGDGGPYDINWAPAPISGDDSNPGIGFCDGDITLTITDGLGCDFDTLITLIEPDPITLLVTDVEGVSCPGDCDGTATVIPGGGVAPLTVEWFDNITGLTTGITDLIATGLCPGEYFVRVTDADLCFLDSDPVIIDEPLPMILDAVGYDISCFGICDGSAAVDVENGAEPYSYSWTLIPGGVGIGAEDSISGLCTGDYQIIVEDDNGCFSDPAIVTIIEPTELIVDLTFTSPTCFDDCNGTADAVVSGGSAPYRYSWSPAPGLGAGTPNVSELCPGDYILTVTDDNDCEVIIEFTLDEPQEYDIEVTVNDLDCFGDVDGSIDLNVISGGSGAPYTYTWTPAPPVGAGTPNVSGLTAGTWTVTIADAFLCDTTLEFIITEPRELIADATIISHPNCHDACDGSVEVVITGGTGPYITTWDDPLSQTTLVASDLCAGTYTVNIVDANGCTATDVITLVEPDEFDIDVSQVDIDCFGECVGTATVTMNAGGSPPYTYLWDDPSLQTTPTAVTLCAGTYNVTVTDNRDCDTVLTFIITEPAELIVDIEIINSSCFDACDGAANVVPTGGVGPYTYEWYDAATDTPLGIDNDSIADLCPGFYYAIVTDANGCETTTDEIEIEELPEIETTIVSIVDATCGECDGTAELSSIGGDGGFSYNWEPDPLTGDGSESVTGLCAGAYSVTITDGAGCQDIITVSIDNIALEVLELDSVDVSCFGLCDGEVSVTFVELDPPYTIEWFDNLTGLSIGEFGPTAIGLCAGEYLAVVTNNTGCITSGVVVVNEPDDITGSITPTRTSCTAVCDGAADALIIGGTGDLTYDWGLALPGSGEGTPNVSGLCPGPWQVTVTDERGCTKIFRTTIIAPPEIIIASEFSSDITCFGEIDGSATVIASGGTPGYTYEWFDCATALPIGQTTPTAVGLAPGTYRCTVTDINGCDVSSSCIEILDGDLLTADITIRAVSCYGECDGRIVVIPGGGVPSYFYQWLNEAGDPLPGQTNDTISNLCRGVYNLRITDLNGCTQLFGPFDLTNPDSPWDVIISTTNPTCDDDCDASATAIVLAGNNPPYTYLWDDPLVQRTPTANFLCEGFYTLVISDAGVCDTTILVEIVPNDPIIANITSITRNPCFGDCIGAVTVEPHGGTGPYTILWSDGQVGGTASDLCAGPITLSITDALGCTKDTIINIIESPELTIASSFSNNSSCGRCNGSATVNITGGAVPYDYDWIPDPLFGDGTNSAAGICAGVTRVEITDANGCTLTETFAISDVSSEDVTVTTIDASCFGVCDGIADADFTCSIEPCAQLWYDGETGLSIGETSTTATDLCEGEYYIEVTNGVGCVSVTLAEILAPEEIIIDEVITPITCNGDEDATITITPSGGSGGGYTYAWSPIPSNGDGTNEALDIGAGIWSVTVTDSDGCTEEFDFNITNPSPIVLVADPSNPTCFGYCNGTITVSASGGGGAYTYQWFQSGVLLPGEDAPLIAGICPDNYNVIVTDANGCTATLPIDITISEPVPIVSSFEKTDVTCYSECDGTISLTISGGEPGYFINWYDGITDLLLGLGGPVATDLCPGTYYAVITDNNGCTHTTDDIIITDPTELTFTITSADATCFGTCDGEASIVVSGGTPDYNYSWLTLAGDPILGGNTPDVEDLCAGNYTVEVIDDNGCSIGVHNVLINSNPEIEAIIFTNDADCGIANGNATVFVSDGIGPFTYQWYDAVLDPIPGEIDATLTDVVSGIYFIIVTDATGCTQDFLITISDLDGPDINFVSLTNPSCFEGNDGSIQVTIEGDDPPFTTIWNPGGIIAEDPTSLSANDYILRVADALGCISFFDTTLVDPTPIHSSATIVNTECGECNGSIEVSPLGGTGILTTEWNTGAITNAISDLCSGVYEVEITDANGCTNSDYYIVENSSGLTAITSINPVTCLDACDGTVSVEGFGGDAPYTYLWLHDGSVDPDLIDLCSGSYFVQVTDSTGCQSTVEATLPDLNEIEATATIINPGCGESNGSITVISEGGVLPHTYLWSTGEPSNSIDGVPAGIYTLTVTDINGCSKDFTYFLNNINGPIAILEATDVNCFNDCSGTIDTVSIAGGTRPFSFNWLDESGTDIGETAPLVEDLCVGEYTLQITDDIGCITFSTAIIEQPDTILPNPITSIATTCFNTCDGTLIVNPIGGTFPFTYEWDDPEAQTTASAVDLCGDTYNVTITDANGCTVQQAGTVITPDEIIISLDSIKAATCPDAIDGGIFITIIGGAEPFTYEWTEETRTETFDTQDLTDLTPKDYYLKLIDSNGCEVIDTFTVTSLIDLIAYAGNDTLLCLGEDLLLIGSSNLEEEVNYTWYDSSMNVLSNIDSLLITREETGETYYILEVVYIGCTAYDTVFINTPEPPFVDAGDDFEMYPDQTELLGGSPTTDPENTVVWSPADFLDDTLIFNPSIYKPDNSGTYYVTATDTNGCMNIDSIYIEILPNFIIPDGVSPNGDGLNDTWILKFIEQYPGINISINVFNRWGDLLFESDQSYADDWDGTTKDGKRLASGTYYYVIDIEHEDFPDPITGPITLMW